MKSGTDLEVIRNLILYENVKPKPKGPELLASSKVPTILLASTLALVHSIIL